MCIAHGGYRFGIPRELLDASGKQTPIAQDVSPLVRRILSYRICGTRQEIRRLETARAILSVSRHPSDSSSQAARVGRLSALINHNIRDFLALRTTSPHTARYKRYLAVQNSRRRARLLARLRAADYRVYHHTISTLGIMNARYEGLTTDAASEGFHHRAPASMV